MAEVNQQNGALLQAFRAMYHRFVESVQQAGVSPSDPNMLSRLGDEVDEYSSLLTQHSSIFGSDEHTVLTANIATLQSDIRQLYSQALDESHHGHPTVVETIHTGRPGRPAVHIDPEFLQWAYSQRSTSAIGRFLGVGRRTVRNALITYGIAQPQASPFISLEADEPDSNLPNEIVPDNITLPANSEDDPLLNPAPQHQPQLSGDILEPTADLNPQQHPVSYTGPLSGISDSDLDNLIIRLRHHYTRAGVTMLEGMLRRLGHRIPRERIRLSLHRIDPVHRVFERIRIRRRVYSVPGPNSLWHHDGQHGLIRWGIVIHGFIDGYSRLITGLRASNNNTGQTVLDIFLAAAAEYGVPSRLRGDHGVENILVAAWMENFRGTRRGSYIWGRSVHNVRIERLWVDITNQIGASWAATFTNLELYHGLDINNTNHIWLLHHLFLATLNQQLSFFAESWNQHQIQIRGGPNRSPADMFGFDMLVYGVRGDQLPPDDSMSPEELEVFGVDWTALRDDNILCSVRENTPFQEEPTSWIGWVGPPEHLNEVPLYPPETAIADDMSTFNAQIQNRVALAGDDVTIELIWTHGLAIAHDMYSNIF